MSSQNHHVGFLDGLRGFAALWVLVGHMMILTGFNIPIVVLPDLAVDLFILISGFLMTFKYQERRDVEPWNEPDTWLRFWTRRFFRIAPLYYVALAVAIAIGPWLGDARHAIAEIVPASATEDLRYFDQSLTNVLMHVSFLFGLSPAYHFRSALPDWSIGLEMQYYALFPFLMLAIAAIGWWRAGLGIAAAGIVAALILRHFGIVFDEPAFLGLKLQIFLAGMLMAASLGTPTRQLPIYAGAVAVLMILPFGGSHDRLHLVVRLVLAMLFFVLLHRHRLPAGIRRPFLALADGLAGRLGHGLGELSYGAYLVHLLVMLPVLGWLASNEPDMRHSGQFLIGLVVVVPVTYAIAALAHVAVEKPGIELGRRLLRRKSQPKLAARL